MAHVVWWFLKYKQNWFLYHSVWVYVCRTFLKYFILKLEVALLMRLVSSYSSYLIFPTQMYIVAQLWMSWRPEIGWKLNPEH